MFVFNLKKIIAHFDLVLVSLFGHFIDFLETGEFTAHVDKSNILSLF